MIMRSSVLLIKFCIMIIVFLRGGAGNVLSTFEIITLLTSHRNAAKKNFAIQRDGVGREEGGGFRMGNTCIPVADSF